jgi:PleD family two-component response regulator
MMVIVVVLAWTGSGLMPDCAEIDIFADLRSGWRPACAQPIRNVVINVDVPIDAETAFRLLSAHARSETTAMMQVDSISQRGTRPAVRTMMVVGRDPDERILEAVTEGGGYDVVVVEPTATAYSRIKRLTPSIVVLTMDFNDVEACHLLSMLKLDRETSQIPLFTCLLEPVAAQSNV